MERTLVVWRRLGKEHGEGRGFKVNPPEVVAAHIQQKAAAFRETPDEGWRWWQISDELIVERPYPGIGFGPKSFLYYLPRKKWAIIENACFPNLGEDWPWYVHIGSICHEETHGCWVFTDLFCDVIVQKDLRTHSVLDLNDLAMALDMGLIPNSQLAAALDSTQELVDIIRAGEFPPPELAERQALVAELLIPDDRQ